MSPPWRQRATNRDASNNNMFTQIADHGDCLKLRNATQRNVTQRNVT